MKVNSEKSLKVATKTLERYGSWTKMRENSRRIDGVLVVGKPKKAKLVEAAA